MPLDLLCLDRFNGSRFSCDGGVVKEGLRPVGFDTSASQCELGHDGPTINYYRNCKVRKGSL